MEGGGIASLIPNLVTKWMHRKLEGPEGSSGHGGKEESLPY
jgi:hypothetical protein